MARELDFSSAQWICGSGLPDPSGPTDVPFAPYENDKDWFDRPVIDVIGDVASRHPAKIAIDDGAIRLTYSQLYAMACRLSHAICRAELPPGAIGIKLASDAFHPVAILGCFAAGRPCVLMSNDHPPEYNQNLIAASGLQALLVNAADARHSSIKSGPRLIPIEPLLMTGESFDEQPAGRLEIDEPAFIVSTSGSTGVPKLITRSQRALLQEAYNNTHAQHLNENDKFLNLGASTSGPATRAFFYLMIGATLHLIDVPHAGMGYVLRMLRDQKITILGSTVSLFKSLSQLEDARSHFASLRMLCISGEMLLQTDLTQIRSALPPGCRISYFFGMTETAAVAEWLVPENDNHDPFRAAAGYLVPETDILIVDDEGRPCAPGEIGELIVRSQRVAEGEWVNGHVVSDQFPRDPTNPAKRIYRTGDLARIFPDGVMVLHGRKDRMVKIRGQRVEPALVETEIRNVSGVVDAAVVVKQDDNDVRIYAFIVPNPQQGDDLISEVSHALKTALPSYMQPSEIVIVKSLPNNAGGKVDVKALLALISSDGGAVAPSDAGAAPSVSHDPVSGRALEMIANAWRAAFRTVPRDSSLSFEAAGGDSLKFMQIIFRLEQISGASLPLDAFDVSMTQRDMARRLDFLLGGGVESRRSGKQVFLLPGIGGDEPRLLQFRIGCAPELSVICLEYGDWTQWVEQGFGFDTIVDRLIARIQDSAPTGPLCLAGYSFGGWMALLLAARLLAAGREIEHLLILDTNAIGLRGGAVALDQLPPTLRQEFGELRQARWRGEGKFALAEFAARRLVRPRWSLLLRWLARHRRGVLPGRLDFYLSFCINEQYLKQVSNWHRRIQNIPRLRVPITVFKTGHGGAAANGDAGWSQHASNVTVVPVGGNHFTMFNLPHLTDLCARFKAACPIETAQGSSRREEPSKSELV